MARRSFITAEAYYGNSAWHGGYYNGGYHNSYGYNNAYNHSGNNYNNYHGGQHLQQERSGNTVNVNRTRRTSTPIALPLRTPGRSTTMRAEDRRLKRHEWTLRRIRRFWWLVLESGERSRLGKHAFQRLQRRPILAVAASAAAVFGDSRPLEFDCEGTEK